MQITTQHVTDTVDTLNAAFSQTRIPEDYEVCNDCVDQIKEALQETIQAYEELYATVRKNQLQLNMLQFLNSVRRIRNTNHCLRIHRDQFVAEADKYYNHLKLTYTSDVAPIILNEALLTHEEARKSVFEALHALQRTAAAFGVCTKPKTYY
ncbi:MAG: hypothetical protein ACMXYD_02255 [Candidatus Woesearchaeota archaeon]